VDIVSLHRTEERHSYFAANAGAPIAYDAGTQAFVVVSQADAEAIFRQTGLHAGTADSATAYRGLRERYGWSFPNLLFAFEHLPLANDGDLHRAQRKKMAEFLRSRRQGAQPAIAAAVDFHAAKLLPNVEIEVVGELLEPLVAATVNAYTGVSMPETIGAQGTTMIFDRMISIRKRREIEETVGELRAAVRRHLPPDAAAAEEGMLLALHILGQDTLVGTIGESLYRLFIANLGKRLDSVAFPAIPNETGVSVIERVVDEPFEYGGHRFARGDRLRMQMQCFAYSPEPSDRAKIFGVGSHACLGRQMSLDLWTALVGKLAQLPYLVDVLDYAVRGNDYVFTVPNTLAVRLVP
jgi:cytochrome P450